MAKKYKAWVYVEVDDGIEARDMCEPAKLLETENLGEMVTFLSNLNFAPGYTPNIADEETAE